jgi:hypothetical protein
MHPDIKTFSDILDIDTAEQLQVQLIIQTHGEIHYRMRLNGHLISDTDTVYTVGLFSPIRLKCTVIDTCDGAVEIKLLSANGHEILPKYQHLASPQTTWIDRPGVWEFHMADAFYPWYHKISGQGFVA